MAAKKPRLSGASVANEETPTRRDWRRVGILRCARPALPSPGSLVLVQTAQVVTETLVPARTIHPQVDRQSVVMLLCFHRHKKPRALGRWSWSPRGWTITRALEWRAANAMTYWSRQSRRHT